MTDLFIRTIECPGYSVLFVTGELDVCTQHQAEQELGRLSQEGHHCLVLDLSGLRFCDVGGLRLILTSAHHCVRAGGYLQLRGMNRSLVRLAQLLFLRPEVAALSPPGWVLAADQYRDNVEALA
ncbi:STAS domain-containing protein [Nonomuraea endophytica]|uniref:STAS domain-containing protein n=1 Tax=Nonomuraea endophytica TaxID=714136 RepID=UPI0037C874EA